MMQHARRTETELMEPPRDGEFLFEEETEMDVRLAQRIVNVWRRLGETLSEFHAFVTRYPVFSVALGVGVGVIGSSLLLQF